MYSQISANKRKTVFLMFVFFVFVGLITVGVGWYLNNYSITLIAIIFSLFYLLWSYLGSAKLALAVNGAHQIEKKDNPRLWRIVENLCITTGLPMPKVYIIDDPALNAFATGRDPNHSSVAVTQGLLDTMDDSELEAVVAHELGHIQNYDIRVSMIAFGLVAIISIVSDLVLRWMFWGRALGDEDESPGGNNPLFLIFAIVALVIAPIVATMIQLAISRKREYLADATSVQTTRYPDAMISALQKIGTVGSTVKKQNASTAHLFFANPLSKRSFSNLFSTHPPIEERIKALQEMGTKA